MRFFIILYLTPGSSVLSAENQAEKYPVTNATVPAAILIPCAKVISPAALQIIIKSAAKHIK